MQKGEFYKALDDFRVCFAGAAERACLCVRERECLLSSSLTRSSFSLVQDILRERSASSPTLSFKTYYVKEKVA